MSEPEPEPVSESTEVLAPGVSVRPADLRFTFVRSSGPGGQSVNKVNTAAQLRVAVEAIAGLDEQAVTRLREIAGWRLTNAGDLMISARASRSQLDNKNACLEQLRNLVKTAMHRPPVRKKRRPTRRMIERRLETKRRQSEKKERRRKHED